MKLNSGAQWALRVLVALSLVALVVVLQALDLFAVLYPRVLHQEESYLWAAAEPTLVATVVVSVAAIDLMLGYIARNRSREF